MEFFPWQEQFVCYICQLGTIRHYMRSTLVILLFLAYQLALPGQTAEKEVIRLKSEEIGSTRESFKELNGLSAEEKELSAEEKELSGVKAEKPGSWNLSVGTSYFYSKAFGSGMMYYTAPMFTMPLNNRWAVHGGVIATHYRGLSNSFTGEFLLPATFSGMALFAAASYQMSDRLVLHGTGVKQLASAPVNAFTAYPMDNLSLGATYKLGNNITIGASIHMNNGRGAYSTPYNGSMYPSPFRGSMYPSPFHGNIYQSPFYW